MKYPDKYSMDRWQQSFYIRTEFDNIVDSILICSNGLMGITRRGLVECLNYLNFSAQFPLDLEVLEEVFYLCGPPSLVTRMELSVPELASMKQILFKFPTKYWGTNLAIQVFLFLIAQEIFGEYRLCIALLMCNYFLIRCCGGVIIISSKKCVEFLSIYSSDVYLIEEVGKFLWQFCLKGLVTNSFE